MPPVPHLTPAKRAYCRIGCTPATAVACDVNESCAAGAVGYTGGVVVGKIDLPESSREPAATMDPTYAPPGKLHDELSISWSAVLRRPTVSGRAVSKRDLHARYAAPRKPPHVSVVECGDDISPLTKVQ